MFMSVAVLVAAVLVATAAIGCYLLRCVNYGENLTVGLVTRARTSSPREINVRKCV